MRMVRNGLRLARGGVRFVTQKPCVTPGLVSIDVFATILDRRADDDAAWRAGTLAVWRVLQQRNLTCLRDLVALRREVEVKLSHELIAAGKDPEFSHRRSFEALLVSLGAGDWAAPEAEALAAMELAYETALTRPIRSAVEWIAEQSAEGRRVVAVSDTRYSSEEISALFKHHGISGVSKVYASADYAANKFSGRLFDIVAKQEGVEPSQILHAGDSLLNDCLAPAQRGIQVRRLKRSARPACAAALPTYPDDQAATHDDAFIAGYQAFGPVLVAFVRLLLDRAMRDGVERLAFVARDGQLPLEVAEIIASARPGWTPKLRYVHLSRRALACAFDDLLRLTEDPTSIEWVLKDVSLMRGGASQLERIGNMFGLPAELVSGEASRVEPSADSAADFRKLLSDPTAGCAIRQYVSEQRRLLLGYLHQEKVLCPSTALVDIGWRASIQKALTKLPKADGMCVPRAYYLGLWDETRVVSPHGDAVGLLCDQRRSSGMMEGSAWHVAYLLESVCRADHGMVTGFEALDDGTVAPLHCKSGSARDAEMRSVGTRQRVRQGVLAYARWFAQEAGCAPAREKEVMRAAQERLHRLAFFPSREERAVGKMFVHSEPTSDHWSMPLIMNRGHGVSGWLRGIRSPWKGGYFRDTGGMPLATAYCFAEKLLSWFPVGTKLKLRKLLVRS